MTENSPSAARSSTSNYSSGCLALHSFYENELGTMIVDTMIITILESLAGRLTCFWEPVLNRGSLQSSLGDQIRPERPHVVRCSICKLQKTGESHSQPQGNGQCIFLSAPRKQPYNSPAVHPDLRSRAVEDRVGSRLPPRHRLHLSRRRFSKRPRPADGTDTVDDRVTARGEAFCRVRGWSFIRYSCSGRTSSHQADG